MFDTVLIANRGEIACRVIDTCRRLGVRTVAVFSDADAGARHVRMADDAHHIGPAQAVDSYLNIARIVKAAQNSGAQAIHPGYGFLSENADFADAVAGAGLTLIGPPASAMRAMGSKAAAKALMGRAGVPLVPGYHGAAQDFATLVAEAAKIGFPVLIKASAGGGGRGMRIVEHAGALEDALQGAAREAHAAFGDGRLLIERYLTRPRHIEIQVFADTHGNTISLFERDCSIQRRHQKVIEEAPAPGLTPEQRQLMGQAAVAAAQAVGYVGAGTVEFIAEDGAFYFMEMNTRLQVEHPVTEFITGQDLVEWQLRVASGEPLPLLAHQLGITGHAIETRIYAEDPARGFLPSIGRIAHLRQPATSVHVRVDTGVREGDAITPYYDAMIAKLVVWGEDRAAALRHLRAALSAYEVVGVQTNLDLLRAIAAEADFAAAELDTGFINRHPALLAPNDASVSWRSRPILAAAALAARADRQAGQPGPACDPWSPWNASDSWRMNAEGYEDLLLNHGKADIAVRLQALGDGAWTLHTPDGVSTVTQTGSPGEMRLVVDGAPHRLRVVRTPDAIVVIEEGRNTSFCAIDPLAPPPAAAAEGDRLTAPIPARVSRIMVTPGDQVQRGTPLLVLEAMKMELTMQAPAPGIVASIRHAVGDMVQEGEELVTFATSAERPPALQG